MHLVDRPTTSKRRDGLFIASRSSSTPSVWLAGTTPALFAKPRARLFPLGPRLLAPLAMLRGHDATRHARRPRPAPFLRTRGWSRTRASRAPSYDAGSPPPGVAVLLDARTALAARLGPVASAYTRSPRRGLTPVASNASHEVGWLSRLQTKASPAAFLVRRPPVRVVFGFVSQRGACATMPSGSRWRFVFVTVVHFRP
ncbi:hypothetical protein LX36DRAFT_383025 [Colletotrichum falcatum]|nr:hypothetical protein LX36DRAFT_383025 [Colletotrichum falcatum]